MIMIFVGIGFTSANTYAYQADEELTKDKVSSGLRKEINALLEKETIDVFVWKRSIDTMRVKEVMHCNGIDYDQYAYEENFIDKIGYEFQENDIVIEQERLIFKKERLNAVKEVTIDYQNSFLDRYSIKKDNALYVSNYTSTVALSLTKAEIDKILKDNEVLEITKYEDIKQSVETNLAPNQIRAGYGTTSNPGLKHSSQGGYTGVGVSIGIIEAGSGRFDALAPQLSPLVAAGRLTYVPVTGVTPTTTTHATLVTSIVAGQAVTVSGRTYEGIATGANVFQSGITSSTHVLTAFQQFADLGVDVINYSGGSSSTGYTDYDREIDNLIYTTKVIFVKSAGNSAGNITSPGKAYNAITVGNAETKSNATTALTPPYNMRSTSSYIVPNYLSNKPEVTAPGTNIAYVSSPGIVSSNSGTSFAAPMATGVIAQLIQKRRAMINPNNYITYFKGVLMLGAISDLINDSTHRTGDSSWFFNRQGAGLIDAVRSSVSGETQIYRRLDQMYSSVFTLFPYQTTNTPIRTVLVFEKPENVLLTAAYGNNFDLFMERESDRLILASSTSTVNTHEIFEHYLPANVPVLMGFRTVSLISSDLEISISYVWKPI